MRLGFVRRYAPIVSRSWTQFLCATFADGNDVLVPAPHLNCYDDYWGESRIYAILTLALWGCLVPSVIAIVLEVYKRRLRTHEFSQKFSLVTFGLKKEYVTWECLAMIKKFAVCVTAACNVRQAGGATCDGATGALRL